MAVIQEELLEIYLWRTQYLFVRNFLGFSLFVDGENGRGVEVEGGGTVLVQMNNGKMVNQCRAAADSRYCFRYNNLVVLHNQILFYLVVNENLA